MDAASGARKTFPPRRPCLLQSSVLYIEEETRVAAMTVSRLILREICYRKLNFALGVLSVLVAVGCLVAALAFLHAHDLRTEEVIAAKEAETRQQVAKLEDDYRKIGVGMGFNLLILPRDQNLSDLYAED